MSEHLASLDLITTFNNPYILNISKKFMEKSCKLNQVLFTIKLILMYKTKTKF